jgi:hypothetical protein
LESQAGRGLFDWPYSQECAFVCRNLRDDGGAVVMEKTGAGWCRKTQCCERIS